MNSDTFCVCCVDTKKYIKLNGFKVFHTLYDKNDEKICEENNNTIMDAETLCIDAQEMDLEDYEYLVDNWTGNAISLVEICPHYNEGFILSRWSGKVIKLSVCSYNLREFFKAMNNWNGDELVIEYTRNSNVLKGIEHVIQNPKYKAISFYCDKYPQNFMNIIRKNNPKLSIEIIYME